MNKNNLSLFAIVIIFFTFSCSTASNKTKNEIVDTLIEETKDSLILEVSITEKQDSLVIPDSLSLSDSLFKVQFPEIDTVTEYAIYRDSIIEYFNNVFTEKITQQSQIEEIFTFRNALISKINELSHNYNESIDENYKKWDLYHAELVKFGFRPIYAEGMFTGLAIAPILEQEIKALCTREYQLFIAFKLAEANSFGGEYPFLDLSAQIEMVLMGEKMLKIFPKSEYNQMIEKPYRFALSTLTDLHGLSRNGEVTEYLLQDISRDFWPNATDIGYMEGFVKKYSKSKFAKIVKRILINMSELEVGDDLSTGSVFLVVIERFEKEEMAKDKSFELLSTGFDIPHVISSKRGKLELFNLVYRFYSNPEKAEQALAKIQTKFPEAELIHIDFQWNEIGDN